ncbi:MAG: YdcH family protein [Rhodospirillales bacterium]|nr:YdcH family protein [Alphaproteobacteria bacterium]MCB1839612.1 YdcH family protein [Alphaproteobacteria bacterium]MCB9976160.1 YdcH family protein [Rhodospirillales bacterium]
MPATAASAFLENPHLKALKEKHADLSRQIEEARKDLSTTDFYLTQLKKQKLIIKEKIEGLCDAES